MMNSTPMVHVIYPWLYLIANIVFLVISIVKIRQHTWGRLIVAGFSLTLLGRLLVQGFGMLCMSGDMRDVFLITQPLSFIGYVLLGVGIATFPVNKIMD